MATTIFFSAIMAFIIWFFIIACGTLDAASVLYAAFLLILFVQIDAHESGSQNIAGYSRLCSPFFFAISFIGILIDERGSMSIPEDSFQNAQTPFCHLVIPLTLIPYALTKNHCIPRARW